MSGITADKRRPCFLGRPRSVPCLPRAPSAQSLGADPLSDWPGFARDGETALWLACSKGHADVVRTLLLQGHADCSLPNHHGMSPRQIATIWGYQACLDVLQVRFQNHLQPGCCEESLVCMRNVNLPSLKCMLHSGQKKYRHAHSLMGYLPVLRVLRPDSGVEQPDAVAERQQQPSRAAQGDRQWCQASGPPPADAHRDCGPGYAPPPPAQADNHRGRHQEGARRRLLLT